MKRLLGVLSGLLAPAVILAGGLATSALAQEETAGNEMKKAAAGRVTIKELVQNDRLRAYEATFKRGDVSPSAKRSMRVVRAIKGGTLERTYEDGKKEVSKWKAGEVKIISEERPYSVKNIGKTTVHLYIVELK